MAEAVYGCPECGSIDLERNLTAVIETVKCSNCSWSGSIKDTVGFATTERIWDIEKIGTVMLRIVATRAAGPLIQFLEFAGLIPKSVEVCGSEAQRRKAEEHNANTQQIRDAVMRRICEAAITAAFEAAAEQQGGSSG